MIGLAHARSICCKVLIIAPCAFAGSLSQPDAADDRVQRVVAELIGGESIERFPTALSPRQVTLRDVDSNVDWMALAWIETPRAAPSLPARLRIGPVICRVDEPTMEATVLPWMSWCIDKVGAKDDARNADSAALLACPLFPVLASADASSVRVCDAPPAVATPVAGVDSIEHSRPTCEALVIARMYEHAREGVRLACVAPTSDEARAWLAAPITGVSPATSDARTESSVGLISASFDPLAITAAVIVLDARAMLHAERGESLHAVEARDDLVWLLQRAGAVVLADRMRGGCPARVERDGDGKATAVSMLSVSRCFPRQSWEIVDGLTAAWIQRCALMGQFSALVEQLTVKLKLDPAAQATLERALREIALALPAGASVTPRALREVSEHIESSYASLSKKDASRPRFIRDELLTSCWESWGRLANDGTAQPPSERATVARQQQAAIAAAETAFRSLLPALEPSFARDLGNRLRQRLTDPWSPWARFPLSEDVIALFNQQLVPYANDTRLAAMPPEDATEFIELDLLTSFSRAWNAQSITGRRICPLTTGGYLGGGASGRAFRPELVAAD